MQPTRRQTSIGSIRFGVTNSGPADLMMRIITGFGEPARNAVIDPNPTSSSWFTLAA